MKILITENQLKHITDGIGDKYAEKEFGIPDTTDIPETSEYDVVVVQRGKYNPIIKNPSSPNTIYDYARGIIDKDGNLFMEKEVKDVHNDIIKSLIDANQLNYSLKYSWQTENPETLGFITVQKLNGSIYIGASHKFFLFPQQPEDNKLSIFKKFTDKAKEKNPNFTFIPQLYKPKE